MSFSMPVRAKANHGSIRRHRISRVSSDRRATETAAAAPTRDAPGDRGRHHGGSSQDRALYSCSCGYAFDALVSTSVDCPHCGDRQAW